MSIVKRKVKYILTVVMITTYETEKPTVVEKEIIKQEIDEEILNGLIERLEW